MKPAQQRSIPYVIQHFIQRYFVTLLQLSLLVLSIVFVPLVQAMTPQIMSAPDAQAAVQSGEMILLDIRTVQEWKEDGIAEGAYPLDLTASDFGEVLNKVLAQRGDKLLGMICATGGRTQYVMSVLAQSNAPGLVDVSEGMHGNHRGVGWLKRGLPVITAEEAQQGLDQFLK